MVPCSLAINETLKDFVIKKKLQLVSFYFVRFYILELPSQYAGPITSYPEASPHSPLVFLYIYGKKKVAKNLSIPYSESTKQKGNNNKKRPGAL